MLTKKHCIAIAGILHEYEELYRETPIEEGDFYYADLVEAFVRYFKQDNPAFSEARFREAVYSM